MAIGNLRIWRADLSYLWIFNCAGGQYPNPPVVQGSAVFYNTGFLLTGITIIIFCPSFCLVYKLSVVSTVDFKTIVSTILVSFKCQVIFVAVKI